MSRNARFILNIVIVIVVIGLLGGGVYFLTRPEEEHGLGEVFTDDDVVKIFSYASDELIGADVTNKYGSYSLYREDGTWNLAGFEGVNLNAAAIDTLVFTFQNITSDSRIAEAPDNLSDFGLDSPEAVLTLTTVNGAKTFYIGDETPGGYGSYFNTDSSTDVYVMKSYLVDVINLVAKDYATLVESIAAEDITGVAIEGPQGTLSVSMQVTGPRDQYGLLSYWDIIGARKRSASNSDVSDRLLTPISEIENGVSGILEITAENLALTGLDYPEYTLTVKTKNGSIAYEFSAPKGEYRYFRRSDAGYFMRTDTDDCGFLYTQAYDVAEKFLALIDISLVQEVNIQHGDRTANLSVVDGGSKTGAFYFGDTRVEPDVFREFYSKIVAIDVSGETAEDPAYENIIGSIEYVLNSGETLTLEFVPYNERNYAVFVNGDGLYTVAKKNIDDIFDQVRKTFN